MQIEIPNLDFNAIEAAIAAVLAWYVAVMGWMRASGYGKKLVEKLGDWDPPPPALLAVPVFIILSPLIALGKFLKWAVVGKTECPPCAVAPKIEEAVVKGYPAKVVDPATEPSSATTQTLAFLATLETRLHAMTQSNRQLRDDLTHKLGDLCKDVATLGGVIDPRHKMVIIKLDDIYEKVKQGAEVTLTNDEFERFEILVDDKLKEHVGKAVEHLDLRIDGMNDRQVGEFTDGEIQRVAEAFARMPVITAKPAPTDPAKPLLPSP